MKKLILSCLFSIHALGFFLNTIQTTPHRTTTNVEPYQRETFLTTFIEEDQLFLNIPDQVLDKPMMFVRYDKSYTHKYMQVVWSVHNDQVLLKVPSIQSTAGVILPLKPKLALSENILGVYPLERKNCKVGSYCINITELVLRQDIEWEPGFSESLIPQITILFGAKDLNNEVIIETRRGIIKDGSKMSFPIYFGFCALGEPMKARRYDYRMGFYNEKLSDISYGTYNSIANISRWRLEKKYKNQKLSVPEKPITFILSTEIPKKWRPYVKAGIEEWLPAFEAAGFKDALVVKEVDSLSKWEMNSINNNIVYWDPEIRLRGSEDDGFGGTISNITDERTGEILKSDVYMGISAQNYSERYFIRAAPLDKRAQKFPFPDELLGELYQWMVAHEIGHTFGILDANFGEHSYPYEKMSDIHWLETMGFTPSVMNYTRPNNIAQPEDSIPPSLLIQKVGPIDRYNIHWAYIEFQEGISPEEEDAALEHIIRWQDSVPWYRYNSFNGIGPATTNEVVESRSPVRSTEMALKNIKRVIELLPEACRDEKDDARLERLYDNTLKLWYHHMIYVTSVIGGYDIHYKSINQPGNRYVPISWESQKEALDFLISNAINAPHWLVHPEFDSKIKNSINQDRILEYQQKLVLMELLNSQRMKRIEYLETITGYEGALHTYMIKLREGLFRELKESPGHVKPRSREIQLTFIDKLVLIMKQERENIIMEKKTFDYTDYFKGQMMGQLMILKKDIEKEVRRNKNENTLGHWKLCLNKLNKIL